MSRETLMTKHARNSVLMWIALTLATGVTATAATAGPGREAKLQRALDQLVAAGAPGAIAVVRDGDRTIRLTSGYGDLERRTPMRATDRVRIGSITKSFVAAVVLQLVGERKLALDDTVERRLPGLVPNGRAITVRQLLNMTSGLFDYGGDAHFVEAANRNPLRDWSPREIVAIAVSHRPSFAPGTSWGYANTNYYVLGLIVEAATGRPIGAELRRRIFAPLHLRGTTFDTKPRIAGRHAHGYELIGKPPLTDVSVFSPSIAWAAGAIVSTSADVMSFYRALLDGRLLRPALLREMRTTVASDPGARYGLGLWAPRLPCGVAWGNAGGIPGYRAVALNSKNGTRQVVVLSNLGEDSQSKQAATALEHVLATAYCGSDR
jgi:D-alanyl-D-alanine carboxypeptidase